MTLLEQEITLFASSEFGSNVNSGGSAFTQEFNPPIRIPSEAKNLSIECTEASMYYTNINLESGTFSFELSDNSGSTFTQYDYVFDSGIYSADDLIQMFNIAALENGLSYNDSLFAYTAITSSQKVSLGVWLDDVDIRVRIDWTMSDNAGIAALLGFSATTNWGNGTDSDGYEYIIAGSTATFSTFQYFDVQCTLASSMLNPAGQVSRTIAVITPDVSPGAQIQYTPIHPPRPRANRIQGAEISSIDYIIKDNTGSTVTFLDNSPWSLRISIKYYIEVK